jgi:hypothetical protein
MVTVEQVEEIFQAAFAGYDTITLEEVKEALASRGLDDLGVFNLAFQALYRLNFTKDGDVYRYTRPHSPTPPLPNALVRVAPKAPVARTDFDDGEPRVPATELGAFLGYAHARQFKELIDRYTSDLGPIEQRRIVRRYESRPGVWQERNVDEPFLTEHQSTFLIGKCETKAATALYWKVVAVFVAVRRGQIAPAHNADVTELLSMGRTLLPTLVQTLNTFMEVAKHLLEAKTTPVQGKAEKKEKKPAAKKAKRPKPAKVAASHSNVSEGWNDPSTFVCIREWCERRCLETTKLIRSQFGWQASNVARAEGHSPQERALSYFSPWGAPKEGKLNYYPEAFLDRVWNSRKAA